MELLKFFTHRWFQERMVYLYPVILLLNYIKENKQHKPAEYAINFVAHFYISYYYFIKKKEILKKII